MNMMNMLNAYMNVCLLLLCMINNHVSVYVSDYVPVNMLLQCIFFHHFMNSHVHGASSPDG